MIRAGRFLYAVVALTAVPVSADGASCARSELPLWAVKAIYAYPSPNERAGLLVQALEERYDLESIDSVDGAALLVELAPSMLKARSAAELAKKVRKTMELFRCHDPVAQPTVSTTSPIEPRHSPRGERTVDTIAQSSRLAKIRQRAPRQHWKTRQSIPVGRPERPVGSAR